MDFRSHSRKATVDEHSFCIRAQIKQRKRDIVRDDPELVRREPLLAGWKLQVNLHRVTAYCDHAALLPVHGRHCLPNGGCK